VLLVIVSCNKLENTTATIKVVDLESKIISGADVHLFAQSSLPGDTTSTIEELDKSGVTNEKGEAEFDYSDAFKSGQSGLFVLDVNLIYDLPDTTIIMMSVINVEEEKDNNKTIALPIVL